MLATILKQPCIWYCRTFNPFQKTSLESIKAEEIEEKIYIVTEKMTLQHNLCSLHGLCPSISEYLTTPNLNTQQQCG